MIVHVKLLQAFHDIYVLSTVLSHAYIAGSRTTLQPIAVGVNGEIGYIAVQEHDPTLSHIQHSSALHQQSPSPTPLQQQQQQQQMQQQVPAVTASSSSQLLFAESERMRQELEQLQRKISDLGRADEQSRKIVDCGRPLQICEV